MRGGSGEAGTGERDGGDEEPVEWVITCPLRGGGGGGAFFPIELPPVACGVNIPVLAPSAPLGGGGPGNSTGGGAGGSVGGADGGGGGGGGGGALPAREIDAIRDGVGAQLPLEYSSKRSFSSFSLRSSFSFCSI